MPVRLTYTQIGVLSGVSCGTVELLYAVCDSNVSVCIYCVSSPLKSNEIHSVTLESRVPYICRTIMGHRHLEMHAAQHHRHHCSPMEAGWELCFVLSECSSLIAERSECVS